MTDAQPIIEIKKLKTFLGGHWVHQEINLSVQKGEVLGIVGGSGSGKTTLLREMLALLKPTSGKIEVFGRDIHALNSAELLEIQRRWGVLFQQNALFSSLTLLENVSFPLNEHTSLATPLVHELAILKILMAGLTSEDAIKYPAELSGGMQKRAGIARAIILDPEILFLDEPTSGLDPDTASRFDELILNLQSTMGLTIVMVTHDLDSLWRVANRVAFLGEGEVLCVDTMPNLVKNQNPLIQRFFCGVRGKTVLNSYSK